MKEVLRTNNPVQISYAVALLKAEGIEHVTLDQHTSILEGSISALQPRVMVHDEDYDSAIELLTQAELL